jgi:hypothetical protein
MIGRNDIKMSIGCKDVDLGYGTMVVNFLVP